MEDKFKTKHELDFEGTPYDMNIDPENDWQRFRVGTVTGLWCFDDKNLKILTIENSSPGNGHFEDTLQWFERSANIFNKPLKILEIMNPDFRDHLSKKRGFTIIGDDAVKQN